MLGAICAATEGPSAETKKAPEFGAFRAKSRRKSIGLEIHSAAHSAHPAAAWHAGRLLLRRVHDGRLGCDEEAGNGGRILQGGAHDLGRVDDAKLHQIAVLAGLGVK